MMMPGKQIAREQHESVPSVSMPNLACNRTTVCKVALNKTSAFREVVVVRDSFLSSLLNTVTDAMILVRTDFVAYCPNLDKGEKPYVIKYNLGSTSLLYELSGRHSGERCCHTKSSNPDSPLTVSQCVEPSTGSNALFPPSHHL